MQAEPTEYGLCKCGCGQPAPRAPINDRSRGWIKGEPLSFVQNHRRRPLESMYEIDADTDCWNWLASRVNKGYGKIKRGGKSHLAHRFMYEQHKGPIPDGLHIDHLCSNRLCVNPAHLEPVTLTENNRRSLRRRGKA